MSEQTDRPKGSRRDAADPADGVGTRGVRPARDEDRELDPAEGPAAPGLGALDDPDAPVYTIGQAALLLGVPVAALRRLDDAGAVSPRRSAGRHRRYTRRQLQLAQRVLDLVAEGTAITAAGRIAGLEGEVRDLREQLDEAAGGRREHGRREPGQEPGSTA